MYPKHGKPGDEITWTQGDTQRAGVVMCRAELVEPERFYSSWTRTYDGLAAHLGATSRTLRRMCG